METLWEVTLGGKGSFKRVSIPILKSQGTGPESMPGALGVQLPSPLSYPAKGKSPPTHTHSEACSARFPWEIKVVSGEEKPKAVLNMAFYWGPFYKNVSPRQVVSDLLLSLPSKEDLIILSANRPLKYFFEARQLSEIKRAERYGQKKPPFASICFFHEQCFLGAFLGIRDCRVADLGKEGSDSSH